MYTPYKKGESLQLTNDIVGSRLNEITCVRSWLECQSYEISNGQAENVYTALRSLYIELEGEYPND